MPDVAAKTPESDRLTPKQARAIEALLAEPTIAKAADAVGVHERTLRNWMRQPTFSRCFRDARAELLGAAVGRLHGALSEAVHTLRRLQRCDSDSVALGAARAILDNAIRGAEALDLANRVEALERALAAKSATNATTLTEIAPSTEDGLVAEAQLQ